MTTLACHDLSVCIGARRLVDAVSLQLAPGELLGIVGTNGAGKTTLLRTLVGLTRPSAGAVSLDGRPLNAWPANARARQLAYLPQGHSVHWPLPGCEVVALGRLPHGDALTAAGRAAIDHAMHVTDTLAFAATPVQRLSGGERARVLLARVLAGEPSVLLADEPLAALDPAHQLRLMALLQRQAQAGRAIAVVLHDLTLAARFCTRVLVLHHGRVLANGAPASVLDATTLAHAFGIEAVSFTQGGNNFLVPWQLASTAASTPTSRVPA